MVIPISLGIVQSEYKTGSSDAKNSPNLPLPTQPHPRHGTKSTGDVSQHNVEIETIFFSSPDKTIFPPFLSII